MRIKRMLVAVLCIQLAGCAGFGIVATSNPKLKLSDAEYLFEKENRPLPAERLIGEAIVIFKKQDNLQWLGNAYRDYGYLLTSDAVYNWRYVYRRDGFWNRSITFDNRISKARKYFLKALVYYRGAETRLRKAGQYDLLTNLYYNMAACYDRLGDQAKACAYFDRSLAAYDENIRHNPRAKPIAGSGYQSVPQELAALKKLEGCAGTLHGKRP